MIFLAVRYLIARRRQTLLTLLGICFGTTAFIALSGIILGFREYLVHQLVNNNPHIHIEARETFLTEHELDSPFYGNSTLHVFWDTPPSGRQGSTLVENPQSWYQRLQAEPLVLAYTPQLTTPVILSKGSAKVSATLIGCDPNQQRKVTTIGDHVTEGSFSDLAAGGNRIVLGEELRKQLGVRLSQNILVSVANSAPSAFKIAGIFRTGNKMADSLAYGEIRDIQAVNHTPNQINEIAVRLTDHTHATRMAQTWATLGPEKVETWDQQFGNLTEIFKFQDAIRYITISAILVVAGFGIYNVLNMTVMQKRRDIAILRSMGYGKQEIVLLFFSQGLILGVSGAILGAIFGYGLSIYLQTVPFGGNPMLGKTEHLLVAMHPSLYYQATSFALLSSVIASILPARAAGKLTPIEIIRAGTE
jgi:lipoprotein-releasing system permease protein